MGDNAVCYGIITFGILGWGLIGLLWVLNWVLDQRCPKCKAHFGKKEAGKRETGRRKGYKTIEREEKNSNGDVIRRWNEQIRVLTVNYEHIYQCPKCHYVWTGTSSREYESFDE